MPTLDELRTRLPDLEGLNDDQAVSFIQQVYYPSADPALIAQRLGVKMPVPEPAKRGLMAVANDTMIEAANAAAAGVGAAANFVSPGNRFSKGVDEFVRHGEESQSDAAKASRRQFQEEVASADGIGGELAAVGRKIVRDPLLTMAQAGGSFVGPGVAIKGGSLMARAAAARRGVDAARAASRTGVADDVAIAAGMKAGEKVLSRAGMAGGSAAGGAMAGGDAAGTAYELVIKAGGTEEEAQAAARDASLIPAIVGAAGGLIGAERIFAGAKGPAGGAVRRALVTGGSEALPEGFEEGVTQYEGQRAAMPFDPTIDPSKGVAAAAGMGAALGGITGAGISMISPQQRADDGMRRVMEATDVDEAIAGFMDATATPLMDVATARMSEAQGAAALGKLDSIMSDDQKEIKQQGRMDKSGLPPSAPGGLAGLAGAPSPDGSAEATDSPFGDRLLILSEQIADPAIREQVRAKLGEQALNEATYYAALADRADVPLPDKTRDRLLGLAEGIVSRAIAQPIEQTAAVGSNEFTAPEQLGMRAPLPQIGLDTTPTGTIRVDTQGSAAPETRADQISLADRVRARKQRNAELGQQTPRGGEPGAGVMVGEGTLTPAAVQRRAPAQPAQLPAPKENASGLGQPADTRPTEGARPADAGADERTAGVVQGEQQPAGRVRTASQPVDRAAQRDGAVSGEAGGGAALSVPHETSAIAGKPIDKEWTSFAPESGTKAVPRADMPQIKAEHRGAMVNFLNARGIAHESDVEVMADELKPTQAEFSPAKVQQAREFVGGDRSILVSSDGHILDGHHQWLAKREAGESVKVIRLDAPIDRLMAEVKEFPSAEVADGAAAPSNAGAAGKPATSGGPNETAPAAPAPRTEAPASAATGKSAAAPAQEASAPTERAIVDQRKRLSILKSLRKCLA